MMRSTRMKTTSMLLLIIVLIASQEVGNIKMGAVVAGATCGGVILCETKCFHKGGCDACCKKWGYTRGYCRLWYCKCCDGQAHPRGGGREGDQGAVATATARPPLD
ncbi:hypothetical protein BS78_10G155500 [Paspalum vaginatum]|nr:hypothetical protein BS78_10G155500 [Paspalum vaginatum]